MACKYRFCTESPTSTKMRVDKILASEELTQEQKKTAINHVRMDVMRMHSFYSRQRKELDDYIRQAIKSRQRDGENVTDGCTANNSV